MPTPPEVGAPRHRFFSIRIVLVVCALVLGLGVTTSSAATTTYRIVVSAKADRFGAVDLNGATLGGGIAVFTTPSIGVSKVAFYIDDVNRTRSPYRVESSAPFDLQRTAPNGLANLYDTSKLATGSHVITAVVQPKTATAVVVSATFTVTRASGVVAGAVSSSGDITSLPTTTTLAATTTTVDRTATTVGPLTTLQPTSTTAAPTTTPPSTTSPPTTAPTTTAPPPPATAPINSVSRVLYSMAGLHEGQPHGVPSWWDWAQGPKVDNAVPPAGMGAMTAWGQVYADTTNARPANVRVQVRNMEAYVYLRSQARWVRVQADAVVEGAHYVEDFSGNTSVPTSLRSEPDGGLSFVMQDGYNFHFWPKAGRGALANPADVGAVFTTFQARLILDDPNGPDNRSAARFIANAGGDWWRSVTAPFAGDFSNNPGIGEGRFTYLTSAWSAINFYTGGPYASAPGSWTASQLQASPPPLNAM